MKALTMTASEQAQSIEDAPINTRIRLDDGTGYNKSLQKINDTQWLDVSNIVYSQHYLVVNLESGDTTIIED